MPPLLRHASADIAAARAPRRDRNAALVRETEQLATSSAWRGKNDRLRDVPREPGVAGVRFQRGRIGCDHPSREKRREISKR